MSKTGTDLDASSTNRKLYVNQPTRPQQGGSGSTAMAVLLILLGLLAIGFALIAPSINIALPQLSQIALMGFGILLLLLSCALMFTRLYHKVPADIALVRTGMGGKKTVLDGGTLVIPTIHAVIYVFCGTMKFVVVREGKNSLLTQDNLRADITAEFFLRVQKNEDAVNKAAASLGEKAMNPDEILAILEEKLESALREVAVSNTLHDLNSNRLAVIESVSRHVADALPDNGLSLETMTISRLDQTPPTALRDTDNIFDARGKRTITEITTEQQVLSTQLQLTARRRTQEMEVETNKALYTLEVERATAEAEKLRQIRMAQAGAEQASASQAAEQERLARLAQVAKEQAVQLAEVARNQAIQVADQQREGAASQAQIEKEQAIALAQRVSAIAVAKREKERAEAEAARLAAEAERMKREQEVQTVQITADAERKKQIAVIAAQAEAERNRLAQQVQADLQAYGVVKKAQADLQAAQSRAEAQNVAATADKNARLLNAEAERALQLVPVDVARKQVEVDQVKLLIPVDVAKKQVEVDQARVNVQAAELANQTQYADIAYRKEIDLARIEAAKQVEIARAEALGLALSNAKMQLWADASALQKMTAMFNQGQSFGALLDGVTSTTPQGVTGAITSMGTALSTFLLEKVGVQLDPALAEEALRNITRQQETAKDGAKPTSQQ
ncbi:MAG TPA: SPFH domain-containing protein [Ktedonosporobacter sp.]|nr:SPFH domain-containing protein [Ktedonosporobacter sp.]